MGTRRPNVIQFSGRSEALAEPVVTDSKFLDHLNEFIRYLHRRKLSEFTISNYRDHLKAINAHIPQGETLDTLTADRFEAYVFEPMITMQRASNTINGRIKALRQYYKFLISKGYVRQNVADAVPKVKNTQNRIPSLSVEQIGVLLKQPDVTTFTGFRDLTIIKLMLDCGIRLREAMDLKFPQVDIKNRRLRDVIGKNGNIEDIPISKLMCQQLQEYMEHRGQLSNEALFVTIDGTALNRRTFQERLSEYGRMADIRDVRVSPHTLRHTFAKQWVLNGGDPFSLQRILRHSTMDMVKKYVYMWADEIQAQHDKFSPLLSISKTLEGTK
jgi:integrase/recombinase XerD